MTKSKALNIVRESYDDDYLDDDTLEELFSAIYGREPDDEDRASGLWSLLCVATPGLCGCSTRAMHEAGRCQQRGTLAWDASSPGASLADEASGAPGQ